MCMKFWAPGQEKRESGFAEGVIMVKPGGKGEGKICCWFKG